MAAGTSAFPGPAPSSGRKNIHGNIARDQRTLAALHLLGWKTVVIWACEMKTLPAKAALFARLPALIELVPVKYAFTDDEPLPLAAEDPVEYASGKKDSP